MAMPTTMRTREEELLREASKLGHVISVGRGKTLRMIDHSMPAICAPGINQPLAAAAAASFQDGLYLRCRATHQFHVWRFHSDDGKMWRSNIRGQREVGLAFKIGQWWTPVEPGAAEAQRLGLEEREARAGLALTAAWNDMRNFTRATMLQNGHFFYGRAAPQQDGQALLPGGWPQLFVMYQWLYALFDRQESQPTGR
ncbi:hypothetical protein [Elioraea sp.]|uniref:hypothetical protein n=1 Tax=Elioraea sp. TaxID=2185103 RepID=UPI003F6FBFF6